MDTGEGTRPASEEPAEEPAAFVATGIGSKVSPAEAGTPIAQSSHEDPSHSMGSTSAPQEASMLAVPETKAEMGDIELQRRKAALLQQVEDTLARAAAMPAKSSPQVGIQSETKTEPKHIDGESQSAEPLHTLPEAPLPPRKPKLQPGDFYITLPKPPTAVLNLPRAEPLSETSEQAGPALEHCEHMVESSGEEYSHRVVASRELAEVSSPGQAADESGSGAIQGPNALLQGSCARTVDKPEAQPNRNAALAGSQASVAKTAQVPGLVPLAENGEQADARQPSIPSSAPALPEPSPESDYSQGSRYGAAAARKEAAQELALEQAILEVHWRQAEEELASWEADAMEPAGAAPDADEGAALVSDQAATSAEEQQTWQHSGAVQASAAAVAQQPYSRHENGAWGGGSLGSPWSDWAAVEASAQPRAAAIPQAGSRSSQEAAEAAESGSAPSGQWSPAELAAQAKAWAEWAAWQAQSAAQSSQDHSHASPAAAMAHSGSAAGHSTPLDASTNTLTQASTAQLAAQAKAWADWANGQAPQAAQGQEHSKASQPAGSHQGTQASEAAQADGAGMVSVPALLYKRYQELEWAEWHRQYEGWQAQYNSWYACYEHWYSSYLAWYNVHGGTGL